MLSDYSNIPNELLPFFYLKGNGECFMTEYYYKPYDQNVTTYNLELVQSKIVDYDAVVLNLIKFYFENADEQMAMNYQTSLCYISELIQKSDYDDHLKSSLYALFINPIPLIQKLSYELMAKDFQLNQIYVKHYSKLSKLEQDFDIEEIIEKLKICRNEACDVEDFETIHVSFCFLNKNCIRVSYISDTEAILVLGYDYIASLDFCISRNSTPELDVFGNAISEKNRVEIINLILEKNEITIKDIEQTLGFTGTNAYYHLSLMIKANMIKTRNQGRLVLYSLNKHYFRAISDFIAQYSF